MSCICYRAGGSIVASPGCDEHAALVVGRTPPLFYNMTCKGCGSVRPGIHLATCVYFGGEEIDVIVPPQEAMPVCRE